MSVVQGSRPAGATAVLMALGVCACLGVGGCGSGVLGSGASRAGRGPTTAGTSGGAGTAQAGVGGGDAAGVGAAAGTVAGVSGAAVGPNPAGGAAARSGGFGGGGIGGVAGIGGSGGSAGAPGVVGSAGLGPAGGGVAPPGPPNPKPNVIPSIKEWIPGSGTYSLSPASRICLATLHAATLGAAAGAFQADLQSFFGVHLTIVPTDTPNPGDIFLTLDNTDQDLGTEGYIAEISGTVTLRANSPRGLFYGTRTLLQLLKQDTGNDHIGQGTIKDFPNYPVRGFMIDVGRMPISMAWLRAYVKFMSYYKMGDLHIHLNDNSIAQPHAYAGFRLESTTYPGLASIDLAYSKQEYAELHALAKIYGVTIISEFDTPAHSGAFTRYRPDLRHPALASDHLDLGNPDIYPFMDALWDEYVGIFDQVHIGTDEYNGGDPSDMKRYINHYNRYLKAKGFGPIRLWGSLKTFGGASGLDRDMLVHIWSKDYYLAADAIKDGYDIISTSSWWYIVPEAGYPYFHDRLDPKLVYDKYEVWDITDVGKVDKNHPQLKGGTFCVWNDVWPTKRYSEMVIHDRVREPMKAFSQKMWAAGTELDYPTFSALMKTLGEGPGVFQP